MYTVPYFYNKLSSTEDTVTPQKTLVSYITLQVDQIFLLVYIGISQAVKFVKLWLFFAYSESAPRFFDTYDDLIRSIFQPCEMSSYIRTAREQNAIKIF